MEKQVSLLKGNRIIVAMSGGVDSSLTAALLKDGGCDVIGITMKLFDYPADCEVRKKTCCSAEDVYDARRVAETMDIPFYVLDYKELFAKCVIDDFISEYLRGRTPNPCILCNEKIKFHYLLEQAKELGADYIATGHYAVREYDEKSHTYKLKRGRDAKKDQSYFLFNLNQEQLKKIIFPIGGYVKDEVRALARKFFLKTADKTESQDICFVMNGGYQSFIAKNADKRLLRPGRIVHESGRALGEHKGIYAYTIGQRKGLGISNPTPLYVLGFDLMKNEVIVGDDAHLCKDEITVKNLSFVSGAAPEGDIACSVKIRYVHSAADAVVRLTAKDTAVIKFKEPQRAVTPGQAAVFYNDDEVIGGGWIES